MADAPLSAAAADCPGDGCPHAKGNSYGREENQDLELWKHFAGFGGEDKNRMVTIGSWLLGFAAAVLWYVCSQALAAAEWELSEPNRAMVASVLGLGASLTAGYVSLLYGGYSNRNWMRADEIAEDRGWMDLRWDHVGTPSPPSTRPRRFKMAVFDKVAWMLNRQALKWAKPRDPQNALAPVFLFYFGMSAMLLLAHLLFLGWSLWSSFIA